MKKIYFVLTLLFLANIVSAQYSEVWNADGEYIIGCENMDNDANKEIVSLAEHSVLRIIDGITGTIEWENTDDLAIDIGFNSSGGGSNPLGTPRLIDVNNDGKFELLFYDYVENKIRLFAFGALTKSAEISANSNVQIENFPNPFNTVTTIKYNVPVKSLVIVKVFDMNGNEIKTLANAQQSQGDYEITFNRADLQNGTYFYQVKVGSQVGAKKMVVIE